MNHLYASTKVADDVAAGMSAKACGLTSCASGPMDGGGAKGGDGDGRAERIERYKKQRREELARHHAAKVPEESSSVVAASAAAAKVKCPAKSPDTQGHTADRTSAPSAPERKNAAPSVRMTKASRLRALSHAANPQGASADQHSKPELPQRGERQSLKPLDLNDNIPARVQAPTANSKVATGFAKQASTDKGLAKRKPPTAASRSLLPGNAMGQSQSRPAVKEAPNPVPNPESNLGDAAQAQEAKNLVPRASPQTALKPLDAFHTFGEEEPVVSSTVSKDGHQAAFNTHCSALPDLPCDKGEPASPKVFSVTFHTTSTSYLPPLDRRASCPDRATGTAQPKDPLVSSPSPTKSRDKALRPWTKSYSPVKQPLTPKKTVGDIQVSPTSTAVDSKPAASGSPLVGKQGPKPWTKTLSPSLDRVRVPAQNSETLQVVPVSPSSSSDCPSAQITAVGAEAPREVNFPEFERSSVHFGEARKRSTSLFDEVDFSKREVPGEDAVETPSSEELRLKRKSERSASLSEVVHGILKANPRDRKSVV